MRPKIVIFFICMVTWLALTWSLKWLSVLAGVLTAIVIGLAVLALMIAIAVRLYEKYGTYDITEIRKLRG